MAELSDEAKAEISAAVKILKEDGVHIHKTYKAFMDKVGTKDTLAEKTSEEVEKETAPKPEEKTEGTPPPMKDADNEESPKPGKRGLWWGDRQ